MAVKGDDHPVERRLEIVDVRQKSSSFADMPYSLVQNHKRDERGDERSDHYKRSSIPI
jgi:hypothetical protein